MLNTLASKSISIYISQWLSFAVIMVKDRLVVICFAGHVQRSFLESSSFEMYDLNKGALE